MNGQLMTFGGAVLFAFLVELPTANAQNAGTNTMPQSGLPAGGTTRASKAMSEANIRAYMQARSACDRQPAAKQEQCRIDLASKWTNVDPQCQKLSGASLDACLRGADRGQ
jgi:hypothetical protein